MAARARPPIVAVCGPGERASREELAAAEMVGRLLAERGAVVLCGGLGGVMEAASRGARSAGGLVVGLLPGVDPREANPYVTIPIATGAGAIRNALIATGCEALIAVGGRFGTLTEVAFALRMGRPVIGLHSFRLDEPALGGAPLWRARTPEEAVEIALGKGA